MESSGGRVYYCYRCDRNVGPITQEGVELACPNCSEGFLEEVETAAPAAVPADPFAAIFHGLTGRLARGMVPAASASSQITEALSALFQYTQMPPSRQNFYGQPSQTTGRARHPLVMLQGQMENFIDGGNLEVFFDRGTGEGPQRLPRNIGDYFFGPGLDQLIQQLSENDPNHYGPPPAAKSAIEAMPVIIITEEHLGTDAALCAVCKDAFEVGMEARQMPCSHLYHSECILPWLEHHNSCPLCRYEMPTDDPAYDQARAQGQSPSMRGRVGGFTFFGMPGQLTVAQSPSGYAFAPQTASLTGTAVEQSPQTPQATGVAPSSQDGRTTSSRSFSITFPWFRNPARVPQPDSSAQTTQADNLGPVSSSAINETESEASRPAGTGEEAERPIPEVHHEDLD